MSTQLNVTTTTTTEDLDAAAGQVSISISGPVNFPAQLVAPGATATFTNGAALPTGTYTVTAQSLDVNGAPLAFNGNKYPPVSATLQIVAAITGPVVSAVTITAA